VTSVVTPRLLAGSVVVAALAALAALAACGDNDGGALDYQWDHRQVLCSQPIDDYQVPLRESLVQDELGAARGQGWVALMHAHIPNVTIKVSTIDHVLSVADSYALPYLTFRELTPDNPNKRAGLALAFDDFSVDEWFSIRDVLNSHGAHVTFFVSNWDKITPAQQQELHTLADDGHDIEPHTVNHIHGVDYVNQNGLDQYMNDEVLPSFKVLTDAGFAPATSFAYPFGDRTAEIDQAILQYVPIVRTTPGPCPY
jgi:peptidoglycan/xylan/chitin deacetylase (PgdA/CDA1 family)